MSIFNWFKKKEKETVEPCCTPYPEYPEDAVRLSNLKTGSYFYNFTLIDDEHIPSDVYRVVGRWNPSDRIAAHGWIFDEDDTENLSEFDSGAMVIPVVIETILGRDDIHLNDLIVHEGYTTVYRVAGILIDDDNNVLGFRLRRPAWDLLYDYHYIDVTDMHKYKKVLPICYYKYTKGGKND